MPDEATARALKPDMPVVPPAVEITAPLVLSDEGHQGVEHVRHGGGDYHSVDALGHSEEGQKTVLTASGEQA
jgi:hypothetical protein